MVRYLRVGSVDFASLQFIDWILELSRRCGIFLLDLGTVPTVWYFSVRSWNCHDGVVFWNCPDGVVFWNCHDGVVFWNCHDGVVFWNCHDGVVFFFFLFISEVESFQKRIGKALSIKCFNWNDFETRQIFDYMWTHGVFSKRFKCRSELAISVQEWSLDDLFKSFL